MNMRNVVSTALQMAAEVHRGSGAETLKPPVMSTLGDDEPIVAALEGDTEAKPNPKASTTNLGEKLEQTVKDEARAIWDAYAGPGGLYDLEVEVEKRTVSLSEHLHHIAQAASQEAKDRTDNPDFQSKLTQSLFEASLLRLQSEIKAFAQNEVDTEKAARFFRGSYAQYTSVLKKCIRKGFDPLSFNKLGQMIKAMEIADAAPATGTRSDIGQPQAAAPTTPEANGGEGEQGEDWEDDDTPDEETYWVDAVSQWIPDTIDQTVRQSFRLVCEALDKVGPNQPPKVLEKIRNILNTATVQLNKITLAPAPQQQNAAEPETLVEAKKQTATN